MGRLAWAAFASALLFYASGCTRRSIGSADGGVDLAPGAIDSSTAGCELRSIAICAGDPRCEVIPGCCGGTSLCVAIGTEIACAPCPPECSALDEKGCLRDARCRADYCQACACIPTFVACRSRSRSPDPCPLYDCLEFECACEGFDQAACRAAASTRGCTASYCSDCNGGQYFNQCLGPNQGGGICPASCPTVCRSDGSCGLGQRCVAPGESIGCTACYQPDNTCAADQECGEGFVCEMAPCSCVSARSCIPGCQTTSDCPEGDLCEPDHRCRVRTCDTSAPCPSHFVCQPGSTGNYCQRRSCSNDDGCPGGFCVSGFCHSSLGVCSNANR